MAGVLAVFCIFGLPIIAYIVVKAMAHHERMELIRMGYYAGAPRAPQPQLGACESQSFAPRAAYARPQPSNVISLPPPSGAPAGASSASIRTVSGTAPRGT
jgi:hypothetical protein